MSYKNTLAEIKNKINRVLNILDSHRNELYFAEVHSYKSKWWWKPYIESPNSSICYKVIIDDDGYYNIRFKDTSLDEDNPYDEMIDIARNDGEYSYYSYSFPTAFLDMTEEEIISAVKKVKDEYVLKAAQAKKEDAEKTEEEERNILRNLYRKYGDPFAEE